MADTNDVIHDAAYFNALADSGKFYGRDWMEAEEVMSETRTMGTSERIARTSARRWGRWTKRSISFVMNNRRDAALESLLDAVYEDALRAAHHAAHALTLADEREALHRAARRVDRRWRKSFKLHVQQR